MTQIDSQIELVIESIGRLVERDGGHLQLDAFDPDANVLNVRFTEGPDQYCSIGGECAFTEQTVQALLTESLKSHGLSHIDVVVHNAADATS